MKEESAWVAPDVASHDCFNEGQNLHAVPYILVTLFSYDKLTSVNFVHLSSQV